MSTWRYLGVKKHKNRQPTIMHEKEKVWKQAQLLQINTRLGKHDYNMRKERAYMNTRTKWVKKIKRNLSCLEPWGSDRSIILR